MKRPTKAAMITQAVAWLDSGVLASALPNRLMAEFGLTPEAARSIARAALRKWRDRENLSNVN